MSDEDFTEAIGAVSTRGVMSINSWGNVMVQAKQKWQVTIQDLQAGIAKTPGSAQMTWEQATLAIALMERLEKIDRSLEALRQSILSI